ncbi:uncharacterized protein LOC143367985 [Andrena cerasifolii]|uniref:uncharacterized protein LOC143367985 n=1 Tax=Andrena cerasifolii TaxID=2819439 RepID=UPI0040377CAF
MSLSKNRLFKEIINLEPVKQMKASVHSAVSYGTAVGAATAISGILGGSKGLVAGGIISSCIAGYMSRGTLKSVPDILCYETTPEQREKLVQLILDYLTKNHIYTLCEFIQSMRTRKQFTEKIIRIVIKFVSEMGYKCHKA